MENRGHTVVTYGEVLWHMLPEQPQLQGAPLGLAIHLCALGDQGIVVTRLGRDEWGQLAVLRMAELGLETAFVQWESDKPTGMANPVTDAAGRHELVIQPDAAFDRLEVTYELLELAQGADCVCFGTLAQRTARGSESLNRILGVCPAKPRFLDLNLRRDTYTWSSIQDALAQASLLKMNREEARRVAFGLDLAPDAVPLVCETLLQRYPLSGCVVTLGEMGAYAAGRNGDRVYEPGYEVPVADKSGAGEAFAAGFLHAHLQGLPLVECCRAGNQLGALACTSPESMSPVLPTALDAFAAAPPPRRIEPTFARWRMGE